jgi:hypothetical protein
MKESRDPPTAATFPKSVCQEKRLPTVATTAATPLSATPLKTNMKTTSPVEYSQPEKMS